MKKTLIVLLLNSLLTISFCSFISSLYHTNEEIYSKLEHLAQGVCRNVLRSNSLTEDGHILRYYTITSPTSSQHKTKAVLVFGEHSRELITTEFALYLIETLCKEQQVFSNETINSILNRNELTFVPIVNEFGRKKVEEGSYCYRHNKNNVDLNRNWGSHWISDSAFISNNNKQYSGSKPFSEWETRAVKRLIETIRPMVFISTHSGTYGLLTPLAYKESVDDPQIRKMVSLIKRLNDKYCHCMWGSIYSSLPYPINGASVDYVYDEMKLKYSFAFEIFNGFDDNEYFKQLFASNHPQHVFDVEKDKSFKLNLLQLNSRMRIEPIGKNSNKADGFFCFAEKGVREFEGKYCFERGNPQTKVEYDKIMINWTNVYLELFTIIYTIENKR